MPRVWCLTKWVESKGDRAPRALSLSDPRAYPFYKSGVLGSLNFGQATSTTKTGEQLSGTTFQITLHANVLDCMNRPKK